MIDAAAPANLERVAALSRRLREAGVPVSGSVEITRRCNLRCSHCYVGAERWGGGRDELDARAWDRLLGGMADAGCLELVFTGGEPTLRPDFPVLYRRARRLGMSLTLFTNATLLDDRLEGLLSDLPPAMVEVSVYGGTAATHDGVTGVPGSFARMLEGLGRLAAAGAPLAVKTVLMLPNLGEFGAMEEVAARFGARWRFDPAIFPRLDGDRAPLALRVAPEDAARRDLSSPERARQWRACYEEGRSLEPSTLLYTCGAGSTNFHLDPRGTLLPCLMSRRPAAAAAALGFAPAWRVVSAAVARTTVPPDYPCNRCEKRNICGLCPPFFELECGSVAAPSEYLCRLGDKRRERLYT